MKRTLSFFLLSAGLMTKPCFAGDASAEALFRAGRQAADGGDYRTACARFEESHRLEPASGTVFNLATCFEKLGRLASAWQRFREAKERLSAGDERARIADERILALEPRLPKLTLRVETPSRDRVVLRDGIELGEASLGLALPVDPGEHEIVVRAPGRTERRIVLQIREGESKEVVVDSGAEADVPSPDHEPGKQNFSEAERDGSTGRTAGYVVGGFGIAAIATSLVVGAFVLDRKTVVNRECAPGGCSQEGVDAAESGRTLSTVSTVAFVTGVVGFGVGAVLLLTSDDSPRQTAIRVGSVSNGAGIELGGSF